MSDFKAKCTKIDSAGAPSQTPLGELTALPQPLAGLRGPTSKGREEKGGGEEERGGEGEGEERREGRGGTPVCIFKFSLE